MKEKILCAAIWYKDLKPVHDNPKEMYLPKNCDTGVVYIGFRHPQCIHTMVATQGIRDPEAGESIQGFLTSSNRFVDRKEALEIARNAGQVDETAVNRLYSEDLY